MLNSQRCQMSIRNQIRPTRRVSQQTSENGRVTFRGLRDPHVAAVKPSLDLSPGGSYGIWALKNSGVGYDPQESEQTGPREAHSRTIIQTPLQPIPRGLVLRE